MEGGGPTEENVRADGQLVPLSHLPLVVLEQYVECPAIVPDLPSPVPAPRHVISLLPICNIWSDDMCVYLVSRVYGFVGARACGDVCVPGKGHSAYLSLALLTWIRRTSRALSSIHPSPLLPACRSLPSSPRMSSGMRAPFPPARPPTARWFTCPLPLSRPSRSSFRASHARGLLWVTGRPGLVTNSVSRVCPAAHLILAAREVVHANRPSQPVHRARR